LAVTTAVTSEVLPDLRPLAIRAGLRDERVVWCRGAEEHAGRDHRQLNKEINAGLGRPRIRARFADLAATVFMDRLTTSQSFSPRNEKWGKVIRAANIKAE